MHDYHKLLVWQKSFDYVIEVYKLTDSFPKNELYGLTAQLRRSSVSVVANIVEGRGKSTDKDFLRYLYIAHGSLNESLCLLEIANKLKYLEVKTFLNIDRQKREVGYLLNSLINSLERK